MRRWLLPLGLAALAWLASGFYVVRGNEKAVVRRFGRLVALPSGEVRTMGGGLQYDLPWPLARVDRLNLSEVATLRIGETNSGDGDPLDAGASAEASQYMTGDKNILHVQLSIHYRISEGHIQDYLTQSERPEARLRRLAEAVAADLISRSGVDFVHPLGLPELRRLLTDRVRRAAAEQRLGLEVEEVAVAAVAPPVRVKADFLDVASARADRERTVNSALGYAEQRRESARADAEELRNAAEGERRRLIELARGSADGFKALVARLREESSGGGVTYASARDMFMRRRYFETVRRVLSQSGANVLLDSGQPVDLTIPKAP